MYVVWSKETTATCKDLLELRNLMEANEKDYYGWIKIHKYIGRTFVEFNKCMHKHTFNSDVLDIIGFFKGVQ